MNKLRYLAALGLLTFGSSRAALSQQFVEVFTDQTHPVAGAANPDLDVRYYELDNPQNYLKSFTLDVPADPSEAEGVIRARIDKLGGEAFSRQLHDAYAGAMQAFAYQLDRYPAIVFNKHAVVYGVNNVDTAYQYYVNWTQTTGGRQ